ncbi:MAG: DUF1501 domain-containing protein [Actinomycetota bacterium]
MLDPDISTADALRHLSRPDPALAAAVDGASDARFGLDRRRFLQLVGMGLGAGLVAGPGTSLLDAALGHDPSAWAAGPIGPDDGILVVIGMYGGNDGLNTVVPITDGRYYDQHGSLAIRPEDTLPLDSATGLHPELTEFKRFWDAGQMAIVEGVGHTIEDFSHFSSMARWMAGRPTGLPDSGWLGRWLDGYLSSGPDLFAAAEIGHSLPLHMIGERSVATTVPVGQHDFGIPREWRAAADASFFSAIRSLGPNDGSWIGRVGAAQSDQLTVAQTLAPNLPSGELEGARIVQQMEVAARLVNANLGFRVLTAGFGDFDSHAGQPIQHDERMVELNGAIRRFFELLHPEWASRVTIMTFSEFGRTSFANDGAGTDHGSSGPQFVLGANVSGGFFGQRPTLAGLERWERMATHVDIRDYYGSIIDGWLGGGASDALPGFGDDLGLFAGAPGVGGLSIPGTRSDAYASIVPFRAADTRSGLGVPRRPLGPGGTMRVPIAGRGGVPAGVSAVMINLTGVRPSETTFLAAYRTGSGVPETSNMNILPGQIQPNMSITPVGADGSITVRNERGSVEALVDVVGYFHDGDGVRLTPVTPARILDSRSGVAASAQLRTTGPLRLPVLGRGGVPASGVDSVLVNLTPVAPPGPGYLTAWASGTSRPETSSLNWLGGDVLPNLVVCQVGADGAIALQPSTSDAHVVADVMGYFSSSGSSLSPVTATRVLDTRDGTGATRRRLGPGESLDVRVTGVGAIPTGVGAAAINVIAIRPTQGTYLSVWPDGERRPEASVVNAVGGQVISNMTIAKLGANGHLRVFNARGEVDVVVDVTAIFS